MLFRSRRLRGEPCAALRRNAGGWRGALSGVMEATAQNEAWSNTCCTAVDRKLIAPLAPPREGRAKSVYYYLSSNTIASGGWRFRMK